MKPLNIKKKDTHKAKLDEPPPFRADVGLYIFLSFIISLPFYFLFGGSTITSDYFLTPYQKFLSLGFIFLITDLIGSYLASFPVVYIISRSYDTTYFLNYYATPKCEIKDEKSQRRNTNMLRNALRWVLDSAWFTFAYIPIITMYFFGKSTWATEIVAYLMIKSIDWVLSWVFAEQLVHVFIRAGKGKA